MSPVFGGKKMTPIGVLGSRTDIDRRTCIRTVPMKVLCLGFGRTGTSSMRAALIQLGYADCYRMFSAMEENPKDSEMWLEAFQAKFDGKGKPFRREEWDKLLGHCMAVTDYPAACFVDELLAAYPDAKVILTARDNVEVWHKSVTDTLWAGRWAFGIPKSVYQAFIQLFIPKPLGITILQCIYRYTYLNNHPEDGRQAYLDRNAHVRAVAPKNMFLEFNVKQGWGPLCDFLQVPVPDTPFPRVNDTGNFHECMNNAKRKVVLKLLYSAGMAAVAVGAIGAALWFAGKAVV